MNWSLLLVLPLFIIKKAEGPQPLRLTFKRDNRNALPASYHRQRDQIQPPRLFFF